MGKKDKKGPSGEESVGNEEAKTPKSTPTLRKKDLEKERKKKEKEEKKEIATKKKEEKLKKKQDKKPKGGTPSAKEELPPMPEEEELVNMFSQLLDDLDVPQDSREEMMTSYSNQMKWTFLQQYKSKMDIAVRVFVYIW